VVPLFVLLLISGSIRSGENIYSQELSPASQAGIKSPDIFRSKRKPRSAPDRILLKFKESTGKREAMFIRLSIEENHGLQVIKHYPGLDLHLYRTLWDKDKTLVALNRNPAIAFAEPDYLISAVGIIPDDPLFPRQWGLNNTGQGGGIPDADIDAPEAWEITTGSKDVVIAVIDSGLDLNHEDLRANLWRNPNEIPGNGIDDDQNGYIDDIHGIDAISGSGIPDDKDGHGTHVSGIIAAVGGNGLGVSGVCWSARIMALRFLDSQGRGYISDEIECIQYAIANKAPIANASFGDYNISLAEREAIRKALEAGMLFVCAAGNEGIDNDLEPHYPASYDLDNIISVAASNRSDQLVSWSNYGQTSVDIAAPGDIIRSTVLNNDYQALGGTSMAAPFVAGLAALIKSVYPSYTWRQLKDIILQQGESRASFHGKTVSGKRINAYLALQIAYDYSVSGTVLDPGGQPITGVTISFSERDSAATGADGTYSISLPQGWTGTASASKTHYTFVPDSRYFPPLMEDKTGQNFTGTRIIYAPAQFNGQRISNRSLSQEETIHVLSWSARPENGGADIRKYRIYLVHGNSSSLLVELESDTYSYWHRNIDRDTSHRYALAAVNNRNREGQRVYITVQ
jgi:subtilisin family serine protease